MLIVQHDRFDATASITVCPLTTDPTDIPLLRIALDPTDTNGLAEPSRIMLDKVTTMPRSKLGDRIGCVSNTDMATLSRGLVVFLGLA
jgi:mRNA interferase MazF